MNAGRIVRGCLITTIMCSALEPALAGLSAGAAVVDITPTSLPVVVNGGFLSRTADRVKTPLRARSLAVADGSSTAVIVLADSCMLDRSLLDDVKLRATERTGIPPSHMLIAATHTHSAPAATGCLGTEPDAAYVPFLRDRLLEAIVRAAVRLEPVHVGFARAAAPEFTALRRWFLRPDAMQRDPFGQLSVRANMHAPQAGLDRVTGETGPEDPALELISFRALDGRPVAVLANFSMHYFGDSDLSADYFGLFCEGLRERLEPVPVPGRAPFVALFAHGCSGDIWRRDYARPGAWNPKLSIGDYTHRLLDLAEAALRECPHRETGALRMAERRFVLQRRVPDRQRLEWARRIVAEMGNRAPTNQMEVYAREQILLHEQPTAEIVVQALCFGDIAIAAHPCEAYAITGLKIKAASPVPNTMVIELANGAEGYIPPPEQHRFGGYTTWPARSAGLEVGAEPRMVEELLALLERVTNRPRRPWAWAAGPAALAVRRLAPVAYWRLNEFVGPRAEDEMGRHPATYEELIAFHLDGPDHPQFNAGEAPNRAPHFAGGRLRAQVPGLDRQWSVSLWFWNGMPPAARGVAGWMVSRDVEDGQPSAGLHLGIGGTSGSAGRLVLAVGGDDPLHGGKRSVERWTWHHAALVCDGSLIRAFLDGAPELEVWTPRSPLSDHWWFGGRGDGADPWEGRLDEIAVFDRALSFEEVRALAARE